MSTALRAQAVTLALRAQAVTLALRAQAVTLALRAQAVTLALRAQAVTLALRAQAVTLALRAQAVTLALRAQAVTLALRGRAVALALAVLAALGLGGCSLSASPPPAASPSPPAATNRTRAAVAQAQRSHEYPSPPARQRALGGLASPVLAVEAFANGYINWTAATVTGRMRGLAALSIGQARAAMTLAAAQTAQDYELRRGGIANSGTVEAIAPVRGQRDQYAVVTRELTTASGTDAYRGLRPAWHVALATVIPATAGGWVVSGWQPEN